MLIDRGLIEPTTSVAEVWPEFGPNGKRHIEFRRLPSHSSGGLAGSDRTDRYFRLIYDALS